MHQHNVLSKHIIENNHAINWINTKVLDTESHFYKRNTSEMLHIKSQINTLNVQLDTVLLNKIYDPLIIY